MNRTGAHPPGAFGGVYRVGQKWGVYTYAQLKVMFVPELSVMHNVDIRNPFFLSNIDETSWRSLSGVHANKRILRPLPNMEVSSMLYMGSYGGAFRVLVDLIYSRIVLFQVFKSLLRCVKLWAKRRGVYGNVRAYKLVLSFTVILAISIDVHQFGRFLRELSHSTQFAAAVAASIAEVCTYIAKV
ncbi:hypothetical protein HYC85_029450 [Camellia sinensis]|uniref:polynucleotide adenylyltransferase n=1 Tax=Camellia sinensis TaxID=4442 RepID=A0A7J7FY89_CAMSI|nr:hypothetical protein HYC85_029450 [Camellia sinensis]